MCQRFATAGLRCPVVHRSTHRHQGLKTPPVSCPSTACSVSSVNPKSYLPDDLRSPRQPEPDSYLPVTTVIFTWYQFTRSSYFQPSLNFTAILFQQSFIKREDLSHSSNIIYLKVNMISMSYFPFLTNLWICEK